MFLTAKNPCGAMTSGGTPCKRAVIPGGTVCTLHGGGTAQARRVAAEMLAVARVPAARVLLQIIEDWTAEQCPTCGRSRGDPGPVIRAATAVLDRTGLGPNVSVSVERGPESAPWTKYFTDEQRREIAKWIAEAKQRMLAGALPPRAVRVLELPRPTDGAIGANPPGELTTEVTK